MTKADLVSEVRAAVRDELSWHKLQADYCPPLPTDLDAEKLLVGHGLRGKRPSEVSVSAEDFFEPLHREVWKTLLAMEETGREPSGRAALTLLSLQGMHVSQSVCDDVAWLEANEGLVSLSELAGRVLEMARRRRMIHWLQSLEQDLRLGNATVDSTKSRIRETLARSSPSKTSPLSLVSQSATPGRR